jgi:tetratricopeptide (TPR) repeat protein
MTHKLLLFGIGVVALYGGPSRPAGTAVSEADRHVASAIELAREARDTANPELYDRAMEAVRKALELSAESFEARKAEAWVLLGKHEFAQALELARKLNAQAPDDQMVYGLLTDAYIELGKYAEAEESAQWMLDLSRGSVPAITRTAYLREIYGDVDGALELMISASQRLRPGDTNERAWMLTQIGHLLWVGGRHEDAARTLNKALELYPDYHYALAALAKVRLSQGKAAEAAELLARRCRVAPHPENYFDHGVTLHKAGRRGEAAKVFALFEEKAKAESANWDNANRELIVYYAEYAGKPGEALRLARAEYARRQDIRTRAALAIALAASGRKAKAKREIEAVLNVGTRDPEIVEAAARIGAKTRASRDRIVNTRATN